MEYTDKHRNNAFLDRMKVFQGEFAFVELTVEKDVLYDVLHEVLYALGCRVIEYPRRCFHGIRQHDYTRFLCLGPRPTVPKILFLCHV